MVGIGRTAYGKYGACVEITDGVRSLLVTTDIGPRIIYFGMKGGENIMFEDKGDDINKGGKFFDDNLPGKGIWHIYGGHRFWKSPEYMDTYYPDNAPVDVKMTSHGAIFTAEPEVTTKLQKSVEIEMSDDGVVTIRHRIINTGTQNSGKIALWALTVMDKGAVGEFKLSQADTGFLPNRNLVFWQYSDMTDDRFATDGKKVTLTWKDRPPFKVGALIDDGKITIRTKGVVFTKSFGYEAGADYPDMQCNAELYTNELMFEVESLSPHLTLEPGESAEHVEVWTLEKE